MKQVKQQEKEEDIGEEVTGVFWTETAYKKKFGCDIHSDLKVY